MTGDYCLNVRAHSTFVCQINRINCWTDNSLSLQYFDTMFAFIIIQIIMPLSSSLNLKFFLHHL